MIVRHLQSVDTLGAVSFMLCDKTGTITYNRQTVAKCVYGDADGFR